MPDSQRANDSADQSPEEPQVDTTSTEPATDSATDEAASTDAEKGDSERIYTQAEVDRKVQDEVKRIVRKKAEEIIQRRLGGVDIEELKAKADESRTLEERVTAMERRATQAEHAAMVSRIAVEEQVDADDAELFLTGEDEESLRAQAKRLRELRAERKQRGPQAPHEGRTPKTNPKADESRQFANFLTGRRQ